MSYKSPKKAIITDAGFASRYLPITKTIPKGMIPMGAKPIMQLVVEECAKAGIEEIIIVATAEGKPIYEDYFHNPVEKVKRQLDSQGKSDRYESVKQVLALPEVTVIEQDPSLPYGNGSPIASARQFINDDEAFIVVYSDDVVFGESDVKTLIKSYQNHPDAKAIIIAQEMPQEVLNKYGIIKLKDEQAMTLDHIVEKPAIDEAPSNLTSYGRYLLTPEVFQHLDPKNIGLDNELWTVDAITKMVETGNVYVEKTRGEWVTTGDPENYFLAHLKYTLANEAYADKVRAYINNH